MSEDKIARAPERRLRLGFVGGAAPSFIGRVHRIAARYDDQFEIVAGAFSSDAKSNRNAALGLRIAEDRVYANAEAMVNGELGRDDRVDLVSILTPNGTHFAIAKTFTEAGFHVLCEKPVTTTVADALELIRIQRRIGNVFAVAHAYTGYTMVRHARRLIGEGLLGALRIVQIEYAQGWLSTAVEATGDKIARNRTDPVKNGAAGCLAAIGTHAFNLAAYVTGLEATRISANLRKAVRGREVPDNAHVLLEYERGVSGAMWVSQVATGFGNSLGLRIVGERASLSWSHDEPNRLEIHQSDGSSTVLTRGGAYVDGPLSAPIGHPEGFTDAFANLYSGVADLVYASNAGIAPAIHQFPVPTLLDGAKAVRFAAAALESFANGGAWTDSRLVAQTS